MALGANGFAASGGTQWDILKIAQVHAAKFCVCHQHYPSAKTFVVSENTIFISFFLFWNKRINGLCAKLYSLFTLSSLLCAKQRGLLILEHALFVINKTCNFLQQCLHYKYICLFLNLMICKLFNLNQQVLTYTNSYWIIDVYCGF